MQNSVNVLKFLKIKPIDYSEKFTCKWNDFNNNTNLKNCKKIRLILYTDDPTIFLEKTLNIQENNYFLFSKEIKLLNLVEHLFFNGEKPCFEKNRWIIPINISFFLPIINKLENATFSISTINCVYDEYCKKIKFKIQTQNSDSDSDWDSNNIYYNSDILYYNFKNIATIHLVPRILIMFVIVWIDDFSDFLYCKFNILNEYGKYCEIIIKRQDLKFVEFLKKTAIIIPICANSFSNLSYLIKNLIFTMDDLKKMVMYKEEEKSFLELVYNNTTTTLFSGNVVYALENKN